MFVCLCVCIRAGSVSVFLSWYRFSVFWSVFQKSISVSVPVFQNIAISVSVYPYEPTVKK